MVSLLLKLHLLVLVFIALHDHMLSTGAVVGITLVVSTPLAFLLGALTASLAICLCWNPRRLKALPQTSTSNSTSTSLQRRSEPPHTARMEMEGNVAYHTNANEVQRINEVEQMEMEMEENAAYEQSRTPTKPILEQENLTYEPIPI